MKILPTNDAPVTRREFERRIFLLVEAMQFGRLKIARGVDTSGFLRVRKLPNGRLDLLSVDESVRLQANMMVWFHGAPFEKPQDDEPDE